jgi:very-short-patch-repair endonuclease
MPPGTNLAPKTKYLRVPRHSAAAPHRDGGQVEEVNQEPVLEPVTPRVVRIESTLASKVNLADFQNAVPVVRELAVHNDTERDIKELRLTVGSEPAFLKAKTWHIDHVGAGQSVRVNELDLGLDGPLLGRLTEAEKATVTFRLYSGAADSREVTMFETSLELLPRNQWGGLSSMPDMVAAFVQPNEPVIEKILKQASEVLRKAGKSGAIDGYQGGAKRAWELVSAIWNAVGAMALDYALPPASFEHIGQKVRGPSQIADTGLATCLDLALLFSATIEQAGLHPVLVFTQGHAFAGVWLKAEEFSTAIVDDVTALRKRVKLKEMVLFESTLATHRPLPAFSYASERGNLQISEAEESKFELAVDIRRARLQRIKPLASEHAIERTVGDASKEIIEVRFEEAPDLPEDAPQDAKDDGVEKPEDRLTRWQRKLLDLSLRNNLLSFKGGKKAIKLDAPDPGQLEDILAEGHAIKLLPRPDLMDGNDLRNQAIYEGRERENIRHVHALDALKRKEVFVGIDQDEMDARLVELYRSARTTMQEGGSNTLYLALGFLSWTRDNKDDKRFRAPLILVPVTLDRKSARSGFSVKLHDDESRFNPTLIEMLRQDFQLELGVSDAELPKDESGLDVAGIWKTVSTAIKDIKGWEVVEDVVLSTFSFAKYLMWKDLTERTEQLKQNPVVKHLIETPREPYPSSISFPNPRMLDAELPPTETFCPLPADSSQLSAIVAGSKGKDFVLIGPPGTGKSQTISNLIAQCLAERKRVLFVSEKMAALDVVYRRLEEVGLGDFCLKLHSNKARKTEVLDQLRKTWDASAALAPDEWHAEAHRLGMLRASLNQYVERLHQRHKNGLSAYEAIGRVVAGVDLPVLLLSWPSVHAHDANGMRALRESADLLDVHAKVLGYGQLTANPLAHVTQTEWSPSWQQSLLDAARNVAPAVDRFESAAGGLISAIGIGTFELTVRTRDALKTLADALPRAAGHDWRFVLRPDAKTISEELRKAVPLVLRHKEVHGQLSSSASGQVIEQLLLAMTRLARYRKLESELSAPWAESAITQLRAGLELLQKRAEVIGQLSLQYKDDIGHATVQTLQDEWKLLESSSWPMNLIRRRALASQLKALAIGGQKPKIAEDIALLVKSDALHAEVLALSHLPSLTDNMWAGLRTHVDEANAAISFQAALRAALIREQWADNELELVAQGKCGDLAKDNLHRIREMKELENELSHVTSLCEDSSGSWAGFDTNLPVAQTFVRHQAALTAARAGAQWQDENFGVVESGLCGVPASANLARMRELVRLERQIDDAIELSQMTSGLWSGLKTKIENVDAVLQFAASLSSALANLASTPEALAALKGPISLLLGDGNMLLEPTGPVAGAGMLYSTALATFDAAVTQFSIASGLAASDRTSLGELLPAAIAAKARDVSAASGRLNAWCAWRKARGQAVSLGLAALVGGLENGAVPASKTREAFETDYCRWWLNAVVDADEVLRTFVSAEHEKRIRDFRELDDRFTKLTQAWVRSQLSAGHPSQESVSRGSEWGLLRYEMQKKSRHLPLRELMAQAPSAVMKLTPCLLMSPLSIAQFLPAATAAFDVVVFDEASQIPVWDAIGAIARGKQVIMVGDPKQLPPTSFFDRAESDADDTDVETDLESILEECIGANLPTLKLSWHYRSRHESLIAFSNHRYYGGELVTFPSPVTDDRAVSFHHVSTGRYEKGGARTNQLEAKALVADLVGRLKSPGFNESGRTIGVVTFNAEQQSLIEDLLDEARRKDPSIEPFFLESQLEPVFVKNLESVQGDERDIMYFSITYGPGIDGNVSMNFGPMNRQGGERRLNVAITRARQELRVFSSLRPEQMDLSRTQALGVRDLKHFLEFAERGARALGEAVAGSIGGFDSPFEQAVCIALSERGWTLHSQVGVSAFRIDLGVVDPDAPGRYLSGIECDGATYHRSATARDRDKLREQVLRGLGWEILRIWSTDWWIDMQGTVEKIHCQLEALLVEQRAKRVRTEQEATVLAGQVIADVMAMPDEQVGHKGEAVVHPLADVDAEVDTTTLPVTYARNGAVLYPSDSIEGRFIEVDLTLEGYAVDANAFFDVIYNPTLLRLIEHVVRVEGPVRDEVLARRIARAHGWVRTGAKIQDRVVRLASQHCSSDAEDVGTFFRAKDDSAQTQIRFRRPVDGTARSVDEVSLVELRALAFDMMRAGHDGESGVPAMAREVGLRKLSAGSRTRLEMAWVDATKANSL